MAPVLGRMLGNGSLSRATPPQRPQVATLAWLLTTRLLAVAYRDGLRSCKAGAYCRANAVARWHLEPLLEQHLFKRSQKQPHGAALARIRHQAHATYLNFP